MIRFVLILVTLSTMAFAQRDRFYVLTYKFSNAQKSRISMTVYKNLSVNSPNYHNSTYQEIAFDIYQEVMHVDEEGIAESNVRFELTKNTLNGQDLTYKMANYFAGDGFILKYDRHGNVRDMEYANSRDLPKANFEKAAQRLKQVYITLPDHPIKIGDSWDIRLGEGVESIVEDLKIAKPEISGKYTLTSVDRNVATIQVRTDIAGTGKFETMELNYILRVDGKIYFDISSGQLINGNIITEVVSESGNVKQKIEYSGSISSNFNFE